MENKFIKLSKSVINEDDKKAVLNVLDNEYLGMGDYVNIFEEDLSKFIGREVVCVNSGTAALQLALQAIGIRQGDEVLIQSITYVASFQAVSALGAIPIPCEIDKDKLTIDLSDAKQKITKRTKAIMPVHYAGDPGNLSEIYNFARLNNLRVVEDAAHAFGSYYEGKLIGSFGDVCCFSFDGIKNITSGEGGCVTSNDNEVLENIKNYRLLGVINDSEKRFKSQRSWEFDVDAQGWRYHMSNIMAALGSSQLKRFSYFSSKRKSLSKLYDSLLFKNKYIKTFIRSYEDIVPHIYPVLTIGLNRDKLRSYLLENNIQTGIHYKPNHMLSYYKNDINDSLKDSEFLFNNLLSLPLHPDLIDDDVKKVVKTIDQFIQEDSLLI
tara:strand:- start:395 stop:1534 length:1140 start_codon:yes stop_codon:yes gene_type:complete